MKKLLPKKIISLSLHLQKPLYVVGGAVRNFLIDGSLSTDIDIAGAIDVEQFTLALENVGLHKTAIYKRTGTVKFVDGIYNCEFTSFRKEKYVGGFHLPQHTEFTDNIEEDALRRDFKCNAIYYDIKNDKIVDVLGGVEDVENKVIDTVCEPEKVFCSDGLRLMRLARFSGQLNFKPTDKVIQSAKKYANNILDISPERIYTELKMILQSDCKYPFSDAKGHYTALKILDETRVLDKIIPELTKGREMAQRVDYHKYDVLEHSIKTVLYSPPSVRLGALLHDVGKPFCFFRDGRYYCHGVEGERIAECVLKRLKADKDTIKKVKFLVREHMVDLDCSMSEKKVRKFIVKNYDNFEDLMALKQADFSAGLEQDGFAPTVQKWRKIIDKMKNDGTPFTLKELNISPMDLMEIGYLGRDIGIKMQELFDYAVLYPENNQRETLVSIATLKNQNKKIK